MAYKVILTPRAASDADSATAYIKQYSPRRAAQWFDGLEQALLSLAEMPRRCALAPEVEKLGFELRQLLYGRREGIYRIIFRVYEAEEGGPVVRVVAIRHGARKELDPDELEGAMDQDAE